MTSRARPGKVSTVFRYVTRVRRIDMIRPAFATCGILPRGKRKRSARTFPHLQSNSHRWRLVEAFAPGVGERTGLKLVVSQIPAGESGTSSTVSSLHHPNCSMATLQTVELIGSTRRGDGPFRAQARSSAREGGSKSWPPLERHVVDTRLMGRRKYSHHAKFMSSSSHSSALKTDRLQNFGSPSSIKHFPVYKISVVAPSLVSTASRSRRKMPAVKYLHRTVRVQKPHFIMSHSFAGLRRALSWLADTSSAFRHDRIHKVSSLQTAT